MTPEILTVGHSTHSLDDYPCAAGPARCRGTSRCPALPWLAQAPHFTRDRLASALTDAGIEYHWFEALGGHRKKAGEPSANLGLRNQSFRSHADHMATPEFREVVERLLELKRRKRTALVCAEAVYWRCHRRLVSDYLMAWGVGVQHILPTGELRPNTLTEGIKIEGRQVSYPLSDQAAVCSTETARLPNDG